ncbi:hypothetical protein ACIQWV_38345 [Streptomyces sp. NPDC098085]|uniref:hypothetical protein n=1 Tax=Streptomyces sp. NPDC098085 TaxID=3366094 RepID=UPI0038044115
MNDRRPLGTGPRHDNPGLSPAVPRAGLAAERITTTALAVPAAVEPPGDGPVSAGSRRPLGPGRERAVRQPSGDAATEMMGA